MHSSLATGQSLDGFVQYSSGSRGVKPSCPGKSTPTSSP